MATVGSVIGSLAVNITANTNPLSKGLKSAQGLVGQFTDKLSLIKSAVAGGVAGGLLTWFARAGSEIHDLSQVTGIAVDELDFLRYAAEQSGAGIENLTKASKALIQHGIDPNRFEEIATKIAAIQNPVQRAQSAMYYFGKKTGTSLLPLLKDLPELRKRFDELGGGLTQKMVDDADDLGDSWGNLMQAVKNIAFAISDVLAPAVAAATNWIATNGKAIRDWVNNHKTLVLVVAAGLTIFTLLAPVLITLSAAINVVATAATALGVAFAFLSANSVLLTIAGIVAAITALIWVLEKAYGAWTKFKGAIGEGPEGNYISRALSKKRSQAQMADTSSAVAGQQVNWSNEETVAGATAAQAISDSSEASLDRMDQMIAYLAQMAGNPPVQFAPAGVR